MGWACAAHVDEIPTPYPQDWIEQYSALTMFRAKTTRIVLKLPVPTESPVELPAFIHSGPRAGAMRWNAATGTWEPIDRDEAMRLMEAARARSGASAPESRDDDARRR